MKNINLFRKVLRGFILLGLIYVVYSVIYYFVSANNLKSKVDENTFEIGKLLNISEDRIKYFGEYDFKNSFFSSEAIIDDKYYVSVIKVGKLTDKNKSVADIVHISPKPFSKSNQENFFTRNDFIIKPSKNFHNPYSLVFNTSIFPVKIRAIKIYTKWNIKLNNKIKNENFLEININSEELSFNFNNTGQEDMFFTPFGNKYMTNILICKNNYGEVYIVNLSSKVDMVNEKIIAVSPPLSSITELYKLD